MSQNFKRRFLAQKLELFVTFDNKVIVHSPLNSENYELLNVVDTVGIAGQNETVTTTAAAAASQDLKPSGSSNDLSSSVGLSRDSLASVKKKSSADEEESVKGKVLQFYPEDGHFDVDVQYDEYAPTLEAYKFERTIYGLVGLLDLSFGKYLFYVSERSYIGAIGEKSVYAIARADVVTVFRNSYLTLAEEELEQEALNGILKLFSEGFFYFSYDYDLTNSCQLYLEGFSQDSKKKFTKRTIWPCDVANEEFFWNHSLMEPLIKTGAKEFIMPIICGHVGHFMTSISYSTACAMPSTEHSLLADEQSSDTDIVIIARVRTKRAGTRYFRRGLDYEGNAAIHVETELIIKSYSRIASFVQIRASAPWLWGHEFSLDYKLPVVLENEDSKSAYKAMCRHFQQLNTVYGSPVTCFNLLDTKGYEQKLQTVMDRSVKRYVQLENNEDENVKYYGFDLNTFQDIRKKNAATKKATKEIFDAISKGLNNQEWFVASSSASMNGSMSRSNLDLSSGSNVWSDFESPVIIHIIKKQNGVFRVNCMDCLDRSNMVQSLAMRRALVSMLKNLGALVADTNKEDYHESDIIKTLGTENLHQFLSCLQRHGNSISQYYTGTGTLTVESARTYFPFRGILRSRLRNGWSDSITSIRRYYQNRFIDAERQDSIDLILGYHHGTESVDSNGNIQQTEPLSSKAFVKSILELKKKRSFEPIKSLSSKNTHATMITLYLVLAMRHFSPSSTHSSWYFLLCLLWVHIIWIWYHLLGRRYGLLLGRLPLSGMKAWRGDETLELEAYNSKILQ